MNKSDREKVVQGPCDKCGRIVADHKLSEIIFCVYEGMPLKNGTAFDKETAVEIVNAVKVRLQS